MLEGEISRLAHDYYAQPGAGVLMLSNIGAHLSKVGLWPSKDDRRSLHDIAAHAAGLTIVRDPDAQSFIAVVLAGDEQRAELAIAERHKRVFLKSLPRALLLAFTVELADSQTMYVQLHPRVTFHINGREGQDLIVVDAELRRPGMRIDDIDELALEQVEVLDQSIRTWCERHDIDVSTLQRRVARPAAVQQPQRSRTALERLYDAQEPGVAGRLTVPIDIALALSRMS